MTEVEQLEAAVGCKVEQWNAEDFANTISLEENGYLCDYLMIPSVVSECMIRSKDNPQMSGVFEPLFIKAMQTEAINKVDAILLKYSDKEYNISNDPNLLKELLEFRKSAISGYEKLYTYVGILSLFPDYDLTQFHEDIRDAINDVKPAVSVLLNYIQNAYDLFKDIVTLIETVRTEYFAKYNKELMEEDEKYVDTLNTFSNIEASLLKFTAEGEFDQEENTTEETKEEDKKDPEDK